ncbi:hypothetical protein [Psychrobacter alimentarius]|uniref:hypothetical protein n=1 Tax=Psychrobacter alimentarius TaxID=261164 RepID=UPI003FB97AC4
MSNMQRLKSTLLNKSNDKWYENGQLYTGIIFFDKPDHQLEAYEVKNGEIIRPYVSPCQRGLSSPIQIDSTEFCNEIDDIYGSRGIPQLYKNKLYKGMSYIFVEGRCDLEFYTHEDGISENRIDWNTLSYEPKEFLLNYLDDGVMYSYNEHSNEINFTYYCSLVEKNNDEKVGIRYTKPLDTVGYFEVVSNTLITKSYMDSPIPVPDVYRVLSNYESFIFSKSIRLDIDQSLIQDLFNTWIESNSFIHVESMSINGLDGLENFNFFGNKKIFRKLKEIRLNKATSTIQINQLREHMPHTNIIILNY